MATGRLPDPNTAPVTAKGDLYTYSTVPAKLAVGNNGETLVADSSTATGLKWAKDPVADLVTTAGDILYATAADTLTRLGIGTAGQVLTVNSGATAPEWATATSGGMTSLASGTATSAAIDLNSISGSYNELWLYLWDFNGATDDQVEMAINGTVTGHNYAVQWVGLAIGTNNQVAGQGDPLIPLTAGEASNGGTAADQDKNVFIIRMPNYADTNARKVLEWYGHTMNATTGFNIYNGFAMQNSNNNAITRVQVGWGSPTSAFTQCRYNLYGVK